MTVAELNAVLSLDSSQFDSGLQGTLRSVSQVSRQFAKVGREAQQVVSAVGQIFEKASKFDPQVAGVMKEVTNAQNTLAVDAARTLLPVMQSVANVLTNLVHAWQSLSPQMRATIGHVAAVALGFVGLVAVGGKIAALIAPLAAIGATLLPALPIILAVVGGIAALVLIVVALHAAYRTNFAGFRDYIEAMKQGFIQLATGVKDAFKFIVETVANSIAAMLQLIAKALQLVGKGDMAHTLLSTATSVRQSLTDMFNNPGSILSAAASAGSKAKNAFVGEIKMMAGELGLDKIMGKIGGLFSKGSGGGALPNLESIAEAKKYADMLEKMDDTMRESLRKFNERHSGSEISKKTQETIMDAPFAVNAPQMIHPGRSGGAIKVETAGLERVRAAAAAFTDGVVSGLKAAGQSILSKLGTLGSIVNDVISAAKSGGPWAAVAVAVVDLWAESKSFAGVLATAEGVVKLAAKAFGAFFDALSKVTTGILGGVSDVIGAVIDDVMPLFMQLGNALKVIAPILEVVGMILKGLQPVFQLFGAVLQVIVFVLTVIVQGVFQALRAAGLIILGIIKGVSDVWNGIIGAIQSVFRSLGGLDIFGAKPLDFLNKWADGLENAKAKTDGLDAAFDALKNTSFDAATDQANATGQVAKAAGQAATALQRLSEELTNIPQGFKVAAARFGAASGPGGDFSTLPYNTTGQGTVINVYVEGSIVSADGLTSSVQKALDSTGFRKHGWSWGS